MTGSANQRPNTPCIRLLIDVTFRGFENSISSHTILITAPINKLHHKLSQLYCTLIKTELHHVLHCQIQLVHPWEFKMRIGPPYPHGYHKR